MLISDILVAHWFAMTWHESCNDFDSRIEASAKDAHFNDTVFLLSQPDADNPAGDKVSANKAILALISPVFYAQFYGPLATTNNGPIEIVDGTAQGFKQLIKFINNPKSYKVQAKKVPEVFNISYFAHKYQIGSLISLCRQSLAIYDVAENELNILNWAVSSEYGLELKKTLPAEHALLVYCCWESITRRFTDIFPNGALKDGQDLLDEGFMIGILKRGQMWYPYDEEEFVLSVAMDYYCKLIDKEQKVGNEQKRKKIDIESKWDEKIDKIKSVVKFKKVRPKKMAELHEKFLNKLPDKVICTIAKEIYSSWKGKDTFPSSKNKAGDNMFEIPFSLVDSDSAHDWIHDTWEREIQIKFKTNQNAVMHLDLSEVITCSCEEIDCCVDDSITFQNEDSREELIFKRILGEDFHFYVKENKETTLTFNKTCWREACELHLVKMNEFRFSKENFEVNILEVNGKLVTGPCYTFIDKLLFTPM